MISISTIGIAPPSAPTRINNPGAIRVSPSNVTFGSLTVDENSSTPYTDATQVGFDTHFFLNFDIFLSGISFFFPCRRRNNR